MEGGGEGGIIVCFVLFLVFLLYLVGTVWPCDNLVGKEGVDYTSK